MSKHMVHCNAQDYMETMSTMEHAKSCTWREAGSHSLGARPGWLGAAKPHLYCLTGGTVRYSGCFPAEVPEGPPGGSSTADQPASEQTTRGLAPDWVQVCGLDSVERRRRQGSCSEDM